jgi:hypothetical protein
VTDPGDGPHRCPNCGEPTVYQAFSGGREWYCDPCDMNGEYPATMPSPPRATLLQTQEGVAELRRQIREHFT